MRNDPISSMITYAAMLQEGRAILLGDIEGLLLDNVVYNSSHRMPRPTETSIQHLGYL